MGALMGIPTISQEKQHGRGHSEGYQLAYPVLFYHYQQDSELIGVLLTLSGDMLWN